MSSGDDNVHFVCKLLYFSFEQYYDPLFEENMYIFVNLTEADKDLNDMGPVFFTFFTVIYATKSVCE